MDALSCGNWEPLVNVTNVMWQPLQCGSLVSSCNMASNSKRPCPTPPEVLGDGRGAQGRQSLNFWEGWRGEGVFPSGFPLGRDQAEVLQAHRIPLETWSWKLHNHLPLCWEPSPQLLWEGRRHLALVPQDPPVMHEWFAGWHPQGTLGVFSDQHGGHSG